MRVLGLISGGKDSCYCMLQCLAAGHEIVALGNLQPNVGIDEMDSFMYQTTGHEVIHLYAEAMSLPLFTRVTKGKAVSKDADYLENVDDEVEDIFELLKSAKEEVNFDAVCSGAILSNYQRVRVENVCSRLGLVSLAYLWRRDQNELFAEMVSCGIKAVVVKVASLGLNPKKVLNVDISDLHEHFVEINKKYQLNICGEGGEYETLTLDCPLFKKKIHIEDFEIVIDESDESVGYVKVKKAKLIDKNSISDSIFDRIKGLKNLKSPIHFVEEINLDNDKKSDSTKKPMNLIKYDLPNSFDTLSVSLNSEKNCLWINGICGRGCESQISKSTSQAMERLKSTLIQYKMDFNNLTSVSILISSMKLYNDFNLIYKKYFFLNPPVRVCIEVNLPVDVLFLMNCFADRNKEKTMHVQSISHWAPANIGPYSQVTEGKNGVYTAGQIALVPGSMELINGGVDIETKLVRRHVSRILKGFDCNLDFKSIFLAVCYTTDEEFVREVRNNFGEKTLLVSVVVPGLPRSSNVEWQVVASREKDEGSFLMEEIELMLGVNVQMMSYKFERFEYILVNFLMDGCDYLKNIFGNDMLGLKNIKSCFNINHIHVFFQPKEGIDNLWFYEPILTYFCNDNPSISFTPVTGFEQKNCNLILLIHCT